MRYSHLNNLPLPHARIAASLCISIEVARKVVLEKIVGSYDVVTDSHLAGKCLFVLIEEW